MNKPIQPTVPEIGTSAPSENVNSGKLVVRGMVLMSFAMLILPMMDGIAKVLSTQYDVTPGQITFGRFLVQAVLLGSVLALFYGRGRMVPKHWAINILRGAIMGCAVLMFFTALRYMPIADAIAVFFVEPFILTIMSVVFLKETVGWRRTAAVIMGFIGALFIIQPSYDLFGPVSLLPIGTAFLFATYLLITRLFAGDDDPVAMQFMAGIGGVLALSTIMIAGNFFGIADISAPDIPEFGVRWALIFAIGALAAGGHLMVVWAFRWASASLLAPFQYIEIVGATLIGFWLFGDFPDALKWVGIAIIVGSGLYLIFRERSVQSS
ncbi:DMT family transporter [Pseudahrensia aquimaris]|uniref:DMT family transporter n=1 Tax=Pseudahrensia aquimaris TaxID=744461 RepID=A0ABW3FLZ9_9HYPH